MSFHWINIDGNHVATVYINSRLQLKLGNRTGQAKSLILEIIEVEDAERSIKQKLATQSFNVVLGALLGFMSASAASLLGNIASKSSDQAHD